MACQSIRIESRAIPQTKAGTDTEEPSSNARVQVQDPPAESDSVGTLTWQFENDTFSNNSDNNLTAAFGFAWTSAAIDTFGSDNWIRNVIEDDLSFLPTISNPDYDQFWQVALSMEMHTAKDTTTPDPPPDQHPYSGIIMLDTAIYSMSESTMHAYYLRLGFVGPATGAEGIQNTIHDKTGRPRAQAWDTQLSNEPIVNLFYIYQHRLLRSTVSEQGAGFDLGINGGAGLGNFYIGANVGAQVRFGFGLPTGFERSFPLNLYEELPNQRNAKVPFRAYVFAQGTGTAVGRYLPVDGNTFKTSRSGEREDFYSQFSFGATLSYARFALTYRTTLVGDFSKDPGHDDDYSDITLSYTF